MRADPETISFRPVGENDLALLRGWMGLPHWRQWWGEPDTELGHVRDMVEGRDTTRPFLIEIAGVPVGYIQYWFVGHHQNGEWLADHPWLGELPSHAIGVDLSLGPEGLLSRGIGSRALRTFSLMLQEAGHRTIVIDPDQDNRRAVQAYRKAGYRPVAGLEGRTGDILLMQFHDTPSETHP